jgi:putative Holliday junction resolvase
MILAFDFGLKKIGLAVGNTITKTAQPLAIIPALNGAPTNWGQIESFINQYKPSMLLVGKPLNEDGSPSEMTAKATRFANRLNGRFNIAIQMQDERFTSFEARQYTRNQKYDDLAATIILQTFLDNYYN